MIRALIVPRHMGQSVYLLQGFDELLGVLTFGCPSRNSDRLDTGKCLTGIADHRLGCFALHIPGHLGDHGIDRQHVTVVGQLCP